MGNDFQLIGIDIQIADHFIKTQVILIDAHDLHGGVLNQEQSDAEGTGKEHEKGEHARHNFGPEGCAHHPKLQESMVSFEA